MRVRQLRARGVVGVARRKLTRGSIYDWFRETAALSEAIAAVSRNEFSARRFDGSLEALVGGDQRPRCRCT